MSLGEDLRTWLLAQPAVSAIVGSRCHQNRVPQSYKGAYLWFSRRSLDQQDTHLDQAPGADAFRQRFDLEAVSADGDTAMNLAEACRQLHCSRGAFGSGKVQGIFITDQADDYAPRGLMADEALDFGALDLLIVGYSPGS